MRGPWSFRTYLLTEWMCLSKEHLIYRISPKSLIASALSDSYCTCSRYMLFMSLSYYLSIFRQDHLCVPVQASWSLRWYFSQRKRLHIQARELSLISSAVTWVWTRRSSTSSLAAWLYNELQASMVCGERPCLRGNKYPTFWETHH